MNKVFKLLNLNSLNTGIRIGFLNIKNSKTSHYPFFKLHKKNFAVTLSFKNKINMFYKHVHPDVLGGTCPVDYRTTNEKSMQELNSYMESIDKGVKFEPKTLKFYITLEEQDKNKEDIKKINYSLLDLKLDEIKQQTSQSNRVTIQMKYLIMNKQFIKFSLHNYIEELIKKIAKLKKEAIKGKTSQDYKKNLINNLEFDTNKPEEDSENLERIRIIKPEKLFEDFDNIQKANYFRNAVRKFELKSKKDKLALKLDRVLHSQNDFFVNRRAPDPIAKQLVNSIKSFKDMKHTNVAIYPSHLIFLDESLDENQVEEFMIRIKMDNLKGTEKFTNKIEFRSIATELCNPSSLIRIMVSNTYSINLPGYITLPYNFEFNEFKSYYEENKNEIFRIRHRFLDEKKSIDKVIEELKKIYSFKDIIIAINNDAENSSAEQNYDIKKDYLEEAQNLHLNLKKLKKILNEKFSQNSDKLFDKFVIKIRKHPNKAENNSQQDKENSNIIDKKEDRENKLNLLVEINFPIVKDEVVTNKFREILARNNKQKIEIKF